MDFTEVDIPTSGVLKTFTIVHHDAKGVPVPYCAAIIDCGGMTVSGNIIGVDPDPDIITRGMEVQLKTYSLGNDAEGVEAIGFGFEPV
jgi:uncharacterized OB-fold protein